jgi:hypothetical protein
MSDFAIQHDSYAISDSISTVLSRQKTGELIADDKLVENKIIKSYVDSKADTDIPTNAETAYVDMSFFPQERTVSTFFNFYKKEWYNELHVIEDPSNVIHIVNYYGDSTNLYPVATPEGIKQVEPRGALTLPNYFYKTYFVEFSGTFKQAAAKVSGKYHNVVLALEIADRDYKYNTLNTLASNYWPLITFKVDTTQERTFSGHAIFTPTVAAKKYRLRWFIEERGDTGNKLTFSNMDLKITKFN